jgi:hypothetical protein
MKTGRQTHRRLSQQKGRDSKERRAAVPGPATPQTAALSVRGAAVSSIQKPRCRLPATLSYKPAQRNPRLYMFPAERHRLSPASTEPRAHAPFTRIGAGRRLPPCICRLPPGGVKPGALRRDNINGDARSSETCVGCRMSTRGQRRRRQARTGQRTGSGTGGGIARQNALQQVRREGSRCGKRVRGGALW